MIHLDTTYLIAMGKLGSTCERDLANWLRAGENLRTSSIAWSEYLCGPLNANDQALAARVLGQPLPFLAADAELAAQLYNLGGRRRGSLADCQIAAAAIHAHAQLATSNRTHFLRFIPAGLKLLSS